jgi:hypothetical protein
MKNKNFAYTILVLNVAAAWTSWWTLGNSIFGRVAEYDWLIPTIAFSVWAIVFTLGAIFIKNKYLFYGSLVLGGVGYAYLNSFNLSLAAVGLAVVILIATEHGVKKELEKGVRINFYYVVRQALKFFVTAVCLVAAFSYYFSLDRVNAALGKIEKDSLAQEIDWGLKTAQYIMPEEQREMIEKILSGVTVDEYLIESQPKAEFEMNELVGMAGPEYAGSIDINSVGQSLNQKIKEESLKRSKEEISGYLGIPVTGGEKVKDIIIEYIDKSEREFFERSTGLQMYLPVIMALALFLTARILATIVDIFLGFIILALIKLFRKFGVVGIKREMKEAAVIEYSV